MFGTDRKRKKCAKLFRMIEENFDYIGWNMHIRGYYRASDKLHGVASWAHDYANRLEGKK